MTIDQALEEAKKYVSPDILPKRSTIYGWIKAGLISPPIRRENTGKRGGMKDIFSSDIPFEIATVTHLQKIHGFTAKQISDSRIWAERYFSPTEKPSTLIGPHFQILLWIEHFFKYKHGFSDDTPATTILYFQSQKVEVEGNDKDLLYVHWRE